MRMPVGLRAFYFRKAQVSGDQPLDPDQNVLEAYLLQGVRVEGGDRVQFFHDREVVCPRSASADPPSISRSRFRMTPSWV